MSRAERPVFDPVVVHLNGRKAFWQGLIFAGTALIFSPALIVVLGFGLVLQAPIVFALLMTVFFGLLAVFHFGLAWHKPVALRMDANGISGWFTPPATWAEIAKISVLPGAKGNQQLAFALHDPLGFRDRQNPWQRLISWSNGRNNGHHIVISQVLLAGVTATDLLPLASARHAAAVPHADAAAGQDVTGL